MDGTVVILGAGATKSCGGPLTKEILHGMLQGKGGPGTERLSKLKQFLTEVFLLKPDAKEDDYPGLPLFMSLIDMALDRRQSFHKQWDVDRIGEIRQAMELGIFELLENKLSKAPTNNHYMLLQQLYSPPSEPSVISLNYDLIIDTAMMFLSEMGGYGEGRLPQLCL